MTFVWLFCLPYIFRHQIEAPFDAHLLHSADIRTVVKETFGAAMLFNLYLLVSRDLSGTGMLGIMFASILGILLIWDARENGQILNQQNK